MSYRFVRVTSNYPQYINSFYLKHPDVSSESYSKQYNLLTNDSFQLAILYTKNLNKLGIEAFDIISNAPILQNSWKKENNLPENITAQELIIEQLKFYKPDVVWIDDFAIIDKQWKNELLKQVPTIKLVCGQVCAPYNDVIAEKFQLFDIMFTCIPCFKNELTRLGIKNHLLYHGFDASALSKLSSNNQYPESNFLFQDLYTQALGFMETE